MPKKNFEIENGFRKIDSNKVIGVRMQTIMDVKKISTAIVANEVGVSRPTVSNWKQGNGRPNKDNLRKIAKCIGVTPYYLLYGVKDKPENALAFHRMTINLSTNLKTISRAKKPVQDQQKLVNNNEFEMFLKFKQFMEAQNDNK